MQVGQRRPGLGHQIVEVRRAGQHLARGKPRQFRCKARQRAFHHAEGAGRDVDPGQRALVPDQGIGGQVVVAPRLQQRLLGQRAGGDQPHDVARDDGLAAALLCLGRVLHLLGDGDAEALADQRQQIAFGGMDRHAAHRDRLAQMGAALGQCDVQRGGRGHGVVEEHLVEIAHPVEQQRAGVRLADRKILRHHRRRLVGHVLRHGCVLAACVRPRNHYIRGLPRGARHGLRRASGPVEPDPAHTGGGKVAHSFFSITHERRRPCEPP